ncbi:MAG: type I restriction-modification system subunit M [Pseudomonadales bacterium]|nr:type I restriction-modification system subunit M [Pseudomonadales bacterium]
MAIKKSELYSSLWSSCDELRGGMDASQYKDYVLVMLFIKYVSDKYAGQPYAPITIPAGATFKDMVALKGKPTIGDDINKKIIAPLANANKLTSMPDFNDPEKLGTGKDMVERLTNLIAIFENKALDFSKNRAEGDDILGDAYEYLMRHFATESGKSKGQFYTPAEVSRIMASIIGIREAQTSGDTTVYDPTCGSGSLLLKVADAARAKVALYGQEKDGATSGLARMNMILHDNPGAEIRRENTLSNPVFLNEQGSLKTFDFVVANPPFSDKRWGTGVNTENDPHKRFEGFGVPPNKNGDYAYLLHIIRSLKSRGKGACILPHGVLFRGGAEAAIRENLIRKGLIKGIIGLPANLFYGTGIPACIIVIDKENAQNRKGIFMIDAGKGFIKDGPKNRLREMDIHRIVDVFNKQTEIDGYSKIVAYAEIEKNEFNLNIPRYIDSSEAEDLQDIEAHLLGDIPKADIEALHAYWQVCPQLKAALFTPAQRSPNYMSLQVAKDDIKTTIYQHPEFVSYMADMNKVFSKWEKQTTATLKALQVGHHPKEVIHNISEALLATYTGKALIDKYDVFQHLMNYWFEFMQDDCYLIAAEGWKATTYRILEEKKNKDGKVTKTVDKGWTCDLVPKALIINRYFATQQQAIDALNTELETLQSQKTELEEEHGGEDGVFGELNKINKGNINARLKELKGDPEAKEEEMILKQYLKLLDKEAATKKAIKDAETQLDAELLAFYPTLNEEQIKQLVVDDKWIATIDKDIHTEMDRISQRLTQRIKELAERYETPLPQQTHNVAELEQAVTAHLKKMGFVWN